MGEKSVTDPFRKNENLNPITSELPSIESMGFYAKIAHAFPYHPMPELYLKHVEIEFANYKVWALDKRIPSFEDILSRWWRKRQLVFLKSQHIRIQKPYPVSFRKEDKFFRENPEMWHKWQEQKARHILLESRRDRFGKRSHDFAHYLQYKWMCDKKYEFFMRYTGLREEPYWRQSTKRKCLNIYSNLILCCWHWECFKIRIRYFPLNIFMWIRFMYFRYTNPEIVDIH